MTKFKVLARLDSSIDGNNKFYEEIGEYKTKKEFISDLKGNGFKFKYKDIKELELYDIIIETGDCFAWDHIHTMKEYNKYIKDTWKYEMEYCKKIAKKSNKAYATRLTKKHKKEFIEMFGDCEGFYE